MNNKNLLTKSAKKFTEILIRPFGLQFQAIIDLMNPRHIKHQQNQNIISPLLIVSKRQLTSMHNRLK